MKLKISDVYDLTVGLNDLGEQPLSTKTSLNIYRNQKAVGEEVISADKVRKDIIEKYKEKDVEGGIKILEDKLDIFTSEIDELMNQEIEISLSEIKISELENIQIKPRTLKLISSILDEENA